MYHLYFLYQWGQMQTTYYFIGVVSNNGQHPNAEGEAQTYLSTGPMVRYAADLLPIFKVLSKPANDKLKLDDPVRYTF